MKSPGWTFREARMWTPANRLARVSCRARATARPPTPSAVSSGVMETPMLSSRMSSPTVSTTTRVMLHEDSGGTRGAGVGQRPAAHYFGGDFGQAERDREHDRGQQHVIGVAAPVSGRPRTAAHVPAMATPHGSTERSRARVRSSACDRVRSARPPSRRRTSRSITAASTPAATYAEATIDVCRLTVPATLSTLPSSVGPGSGRASRTQPPASRLAHRTGLGSGWPRSGGPAGSASS